MSVNKEYQIVNLMRVTLFIIISFVIFFIMIEFIYVSNAEQISKFSAFFSAISSLGIAVTIVIYFLQKRNSELESERKNKKIADSYKMILVKHAHELRNIIKKLINLNEECKSTKYSHVHFTLGHNIYAFLLSSADKSQYKVISMFKLDLMTISMISVNSISTNTDISIEYWGFQRHAFIITTAIENLISNLANDSSNNVVNSYFEEMNLTSSLDHVNTIIQEHSESVE